MLKEIISSFLKQHRPPTRFLILIASVVCAFQVTFAANLIVSPSSVSTKVGKTFSVDIMVTNNIESINAVSASLSFPSDALEVLSLSKSGSFITLWAEEPAFSNTKGTVSLEGVALNPGYSKASGKVVTVTFKAKQAGNVSVAIKQGSVLANDGNATDVLKTTGSAFVYINEEDAVSAPSTQVSASVVPVITSPTHPDSTKWYSRKDASFEWKVPSGVIAIRTIYSEKESDTPSKVYDPPVTNRSFTVESDGTFYMHVQFKNKSGWGSKATYAFLVDSQPPESLKASFPDGAVTTNQTPAVSVQAEDSLSGVNKITLSIDNGQPIEFPVDSSHLYRLPKQSAGNHSVVVSAIDNAGNVSTVTLDVTIQAIAPPVITEYTKKVDFDTRFKVVGATYPQSQIEVVLTNAEGKTFTEHASSNEAGVFTLVWSSRLDSGVYEMRARVSDGRGSISDYTDTKVIVVERMVLLRLGIFVMNWLSVILIIVIAVLMVLATLWYSFVQFRRFRRKVKRNLKEAESTLRVNVSALRRDIEEFHDVLVKAERKRELTKEEQAILKKFKKRLEITEKEIEKKLEQSV
ncbi:MAG: hypothetical protein RLZZ308_283 [Candidatus Parcubacteria bacterium]|jgi:hypothetical protein